MNELRREEYAALRATIRERGSLRVVLYSLSLALWASLAVAIVAITPVPVLSLFPLAVLAAGFEAVNGLHVGVERVGRYIQVFFEEPAPEDDAKRGPGWETATMRYGHQYPGSGTDPLFSPVFLLAALLNLIPVLVAGPTLSELVVLAGIHLLFGARVLIAHRQSARQRASDLERFRQIAASGEKHQD